MRKKHTSTAGEAGGHSFSSSLKSPEQSTFLGVVLEIDELWDYVRVFSFKHDKEIWLKNNIELGLNINDVVVVEHGDGSYVIAQKSDIDFDYEPKRYFPEAEDESKLLKDDDSGKPEYVDFRKLLYISKKVGDIVRHVGLTGYRIRDGLMHIFSGVSRIAISNLAITELSIKITRKLSRTKTFEAFVETKEGDSYLLRIYNTISNAGQVAEDTPDEEIEKRTYMIVCEGACGKALSTYGITMRGIPVDLHAAVYIRAVLGKTERKRMSYASHRYFDRQLSVTPGDIHRDFHAKASAAVTKEFLDGGVVVEIDGERHDVVSIVVECDDGTRFSFAEKDLRLADESSDVTLGRSVDAAFSKVSVWQDSLEHYNYPATASPYMLTKIYAYADVHYMLDSYEKRWRSNTAVRINERVVFERDKRSGITTLWHIESPVTYMEGNSLFGVYSVDEESGRDPVVQYTIGDAVFTIGGKDMLVSANGYGMSLLLGRKAMMLDGFDTANMAGMKVINARDAALYVDSLTMDGGLYVSGNFVVRDADFISMDGKMLYASAENMAYIKGQSVILSGDKSVIAATSSQDKEGASVMYLQTGIASLYAKNVAIPGYCKC